MLIKYILTLTGPIYLKMRIKNLKGPVEFDCENAHPHFCAQRAPEILKAVFRILATFYRFFRPFSAA